MDPLTQGVLGAALPQASRRKSQVAIAGALGFVSGMAADLDVFIRSPADPLLFLEYHRHFTHALVFIPLGGLIMALLVHWSAGRRWGLGFWQTALFCTLGYATHALLDAATSYGTMLFWPFSDARISWRIISVVDPLFSVPLAGLVAWATWTGRALFARIGLVWAVTYLSLGALQHQNAAEMGKALAASRGHMPTRLEVKPSFGNILVWKTVYEADGRYHVDAVRAGLGPKVFPGSSVAALDVPRDLAWLQKDTQQAKDIERFRWFSDDYLALDPLQPNQVIDVRYSMIPNEIAGLWSIALSKDATPSAHVRFLTHRDGARQSLARLWSMITARDP